jgi:hypothetical protein
MTDFILPFIDITESVRMSLSALRYDEAQVTLHIKFPTADWLAKMVDWPTTFLLPEDGFQKSRLVALSTIASPSELREFATGINSSFSMVFTGLPEDCKSFYFWQDIYHSNGFYLKHIDRNETDVYQISL